MKVVHLVIGGDIAGGQVVALQFARAAHARGDHVVFVAPGPGQFVELARTEGFAVELIDVGRTFRLASAWRLRALLRRERVDVLHTHMHLAGNVLGRLAGASAGVAVVGHFHAENQFRRQRPFAAVYRLLDNATARLCSRILVVSDATRRALEQQGIPGGRMETVRNGLLPFAVDDEAGAAVRDELGIPADAQLVGTIGRLNAMKGQREAIEALARLDCDVRLLIVGDDVERGGAFRHELECTADRLGVRGRVVFTGYRADIPALLAALDVFILPSWIEGLPIVILEAMAAARPVVATRVGGIPEVVLDGETGLLVPPRDPAALAEALRALLENADQRVVLGEAGRRRLEEHFTESAMTTRVLEVYDEISARAGLGGE